MKVNQDLVYRTFKNGKFHILMDDNEKSAHFITYRFLLPFRLPVGNESTVTLKENYLFYFMNRKYEHPAAKEMAAYYPMRLTIVEATKRITKKEFKQYPKGEKKRTKKDIYLSEVFKEVLDLFNKLVIAISIRSKNNNIYSVAPAHFIGELSTIIFNFNNRAPIEIERHIINTGFKARKEKDDQLTMSYNEYMSAIQIIMDDDAGNYYRIHEKIRESERLFFSEKYDDCIVTRNTAFEMFTTNIVIQYEKLVLNVDEERLNNLSTKTAFGNIVKNNLKPIITDKLKLNNADLINAMLAEFLNTCAKYRHRVVHRGESYTVVEARESLDLLHDIILLIINDIKEINNNNRFAEEFKKHYVVTRPSEVQKVKEKYKNLLK